MEKAKCYIEMAVNENLINSELTHILSKNLITVLEFKISENIENEDYFVSVLIKHHLTKSIELISLQSLIKYYS
jgi:hypothetical protein